VVRISLSATTDIGNRRTNNEDSFIVTNDVLKDKWSFGSGMIEIPNNGVVLVVADGMGGEVAGELASSICIRTIEEVLSTHIGGHGGDNDIIRILNNALVTSHENIVNAIKERPEYYGMGTTATICYIANNKAYISWVGDSRVYRYAASGLRSLQNFHEGNLEILTDDHSKVWESVLAGNMTPEEARVAEYSNIITQSLGDMSKGPMPDSRIYNLYDNDVVLVCSDGLNGMVSDAEILNVFECYIELEDIKKQLIKIAKDAGGYDNITVAMCRMEGGINRTDAAVKTDDVAVLSESSKTLIKEDNDVDTKPVIDIKKKVSESKSEHKKEPNVALRAAAVTLLTFMLASLIGLYFVQPDLLEQWRDKVMNFQHEESVIEPESDEATADELSSESEKKDKNGSSEFTSDSNKTQLTEEENALSKQVKATIGELDKLREGLPENQKVEFDKKRKAIVDEVSKIKGKKEEYQNYLEKMNALIKEYEKPKKNE